MPMLFYVLGLLVKEPSLKIHFASSKGDILETHGCTQQLFHLVLGNFGKIFLVH